MSQTCTLKMAKMINCMMLCIFEHIKNYKNDEPPDIIQHKVYFGNHAIHQKNYLFSFLDFSIWVWLCVCHMLRYIKKKKNRKWFGTVSFTCKVQHQSDMIKNKSEYDHTQRM